MDLLPVMQRPVSILRERLREASMTGETLNMKYMYAAVTLDIINDYCFARDPFYIRQSDFGRKGFDDVDSFLTVSILVSPNSIPSVRTELIMLEHSYPLAYAIYVLAACMCAAPRALWY